MIIVEGPDGAGKTTLIRRLREDTGLPLGPRASTSEGGPVANLGVWAYDDVQSWTHPATPLRVYDRHPLISDYIYGPVVRGRLRGDMIGMTSLHKTFRSQALIVLCLPPLEVARANLAAEPQMPGVASNFDVIYGLYAGLVRHMDGVVYVHDYTVPENGRSIKLTYESILRAARMHAATWRR